MVINHLETLMSPCSQSITCLRPSDLPPSFFLSFFLSFLLIVSCFFPIDLHYCFTDSLSLSLSLSVCLSIVLSSITQPSCPLPSVCSFILPRDAETQKSCHETGAVQSNSELWPLHDVCVCLIWVNVMCINVLDLLEHCNNISTTFMKAFKKAWKICFSLSIVFSLSNKQARKCWMVHKNA